MRGTAVAERLMRGTALAELLLAREPPAQRTAGRGAAAEQGLCRAFAARNGVAVERGRRQYAGTAAEQERRHRARAPLRGSGAGRKQELARGVRS